MSLAQPVTKSAAPKLKELFDGKLVRAIAADFSRVEPSFDAAGFIARGSRGLAALELTARGFHLADALHAHLPSPFPRAAEILVRALGPELASSETFGLSPLRYMPHVFFVQRYGLDHFEAAMHAQYELTKRFSAESSIRAYLLKYPEQTYARLRTWASDPNVHVRRLVSEGTRPRLPWAPRLRAFQEDPRPVLALLELLRDDPERYVQRSVANNLNDIGKDHPELAIETCRRWSVGESAGRRWIVRHALRSLVKAGQRGALETLGVGAAPKVAIEQPTAPERVQMGAELRFSFVLRSSAGRAQDLVIDYAVHFVKANGSQRAKVFKLKRLTLPPSGSLALHGKVSFAPMSTRRHYPGRHRLELRVNGVAYPFAEFELDA